MATVLILLGVALFGVGAIVTLSTLESKISRSQQEGVTAYHIAESGIQEAIWRISSDQALSDQLSAGTINSNYYITNFFGDGRNASVTVASTSPGYGTVTVTGGSNNGYFNATRKIVATIFRGASSSLIGDSGVFSGGELSLTNGSSKIKINGGNMFANLGFKINSATVDLGTNNLNTPKNLQKNGSAVITGTIHSLDYLPEADPINTPGIDFVDYASNNTVSYTPTQFSNLFSGKTVVNLPGPITYVSGNLSFGNWIKNKTLNVTGLLVINGSLTAQTNGVVVNVIKSGSNQSGILVKNNVTMGKGVWGIDGLFYCGGDFSGVISQPITIDGALVVVGNTSLNTGALMTINYVAENANQILGQGTPSTVEVKHWEEEY